MIRDLNGWN